MLWTPPTIFNKILNLCFLSRAGKATGKNMGPSRSQILRNTAFFIGMKIKLHDACFVGLMGIAYPVGAGLR